ncbi:class I SAM-dependent DNA methyltransferase [Pedobacter heparinus]|uniref:HsdM family class I SAM-dependent methyltransferase n=1 Tax=Pedobacter heparinus TaxID=984 RepID=UPI002930BF82|nr:N-6 DNA methylase [Pedobacter heparinus]
MELFSETFIEKIGYLDFQVLDSEQSPVVFVSELDKPVSRITPYQILALEEAKSFQADAVFFRYFGDERSPQAQIYIYDNINGIIDGHYAQIHKELWSSCRIPIFIVVEDFKIKIFDCRKPVSVTKEGSVYTDDIASIDTRDLEKFSDVIQKYNAQKFSNGTFWESSEAINHFTYGATAYKDLIEGLKNLRSNYSNKKNNVISDDLSDYIIIISILVKYLEENGVDENENNLAADFFDSHVGCRSFIEILEKNKLVEILESLATKFNGGIFSLSNLQKEELLKADLSSIATFFDARTTHAHQLVFWPMYSFKHIPVELISNIYEEFIPKHDKGAVYTPHYLVNLLIDECLPLPNKVINNPHSENVKLIDISCGSGIFLVNAFKRLVQIYKIKQYHDTGTFTNIVPINILQQIIKDNIFGIDINPHAVNLTKFSLCLAICQTLSPQQIWTELSFEDLGISNIVKTDFFHFVSNEDNHKKYDLIIGNPPFNTPVNPSTNEPYKKSEFATLMKKTYHIDSAPIGDDDLALFFLQQSLKLLRESALLCLIQKSIPLLHTKENEGFRTELFKTYSVPQIIDFTPYRRILFHNVTVPTCAIFIENSPPVNEFISHIVIKRAYSDDIDPLIPGQSDR